MLAPRVLHYYYPSMNLIPLGGGALPMPVMEVGFMPLEIYTPYANDCKIIKGIVELDYE